MEAEEETWKLIKDSENKDDLEFFIKQFPNSPYTIPAKLKTKSTQQKLNLQWILSEKFIKLKIYYTLQTLHH